MRILIHGEDAPLDNQIAGFAVELFAPACWTSRSAASARQRGQRQSVKRALKSAAALLPRFTSAHQQVSWVAIQPNRAPQTGQLFSSVLSPAEVALGSPIIKAIAPAVLNRSSARARRAAARTRARREWRFKIEWDSA